MSDLVKTIKTRYNLDLQILGVDIDGSVRLADKDGEDTTYLYIEDMLLHNETEVESNKCLTNDIIFE